MIPQQPVEGAVVLSVGLRIDPTRPGLAAWELGVRVGVLGFRV